MPYSAYHVAYQIVTDGDVAVRVAAAAKQEDDGLQDPTAWAADHAWDYGTQSDWIASVMYALDSGKTDWGKDPGVITDQHILSFVQSAMA